MSQIIGILQIIFNTLNSMTYKISSYVQQLQENERKYRLLVENQTNMIIKLDREGHLLFVSPSLCRVFNRSKEELLGKQFTELFHEEGRQNILETVKKVAAPPHNCYVEAQAKTKDGERWQAWLSTAVLDENGRVDAVIGSGREWWGVFCNKKKNGEIYWESAN